MRSAIITICALLWPLTAKAQSTPPLWAVIPDYHERNSCTLLAGRDTADGSTAEDTFAWQVRSLGELQVGFGLSASEAAALRLPSPGQGILIDLVIYRAGNGQIARDQAFAMTLSADGQHVVRGILPIGTLELLEKGSRLEVQYRGQTFHTLNLTGSAQSIRDMGPCMAGVARRLEGK